jgi:hypothetical protein
MHDYNNAPDQREGGLIPDGTVAIIQINLRPGSAGEDGLLKRSKDGAAEMLDFEYIVVEGQYVRRKFWEHLLVTGTTDGHAQAAEISRGKLRALLESARGIKPDDKSPEAKQARTVTSYKAFDGLRFIGKIGVERGKPKGDGENYPDKNKLSAVITPDKSLWHRVEQTSPGSTPSSSSTPAAPAVPAKPKWA